jgi:sugar/nucleoside kinase (ribokinase family)
VFARAVPATPVYRKPYVGAEPPEAVVVFVSADTQRRTFFFNAPGAAITVTATVLREDNCAKDKAVVSVRTTPVGALAVVSAVSCAAAAAAIPVFDKSSTPIIDANNSANISSIWPIFSGVGSPTRS